VLAALADLGAARSLEGGRYQATARVRAWGPFIAAQHPALTVGRAIMRRLADATGENVHMLLATGDPAFGVFVATEHGGNPIQHTVTLGGLSPTTDGAAGKALLSSFDDDVRAEVLRGLAERNPERAPKLESELRTIRRAGFATSRHEMLADTAGVAAPFTRNGEPYGSLTVSMPEYRRTKQTDEQHIPLVRAAVEQLRAALDGDETADGARAG
jgi:DNA-binding IclR family transcriptional regulator